MNTDDKAPAVDAEWRDAEAGELLQQAMQIAELWKACVDAPALRAILQRLIARQSVIDKLNAAPTSPHDVDAAYRDGYATGAMHSGAIKVPGFRERPDAKDVEGDVEDLRLSDGFAIGWNECIMEVLRENATSSHDVDAIGELLKQWRGGADSNAKSIKAPGVSEGLDVALRTEARVLRRCADELEAVLADVDAVRVDEAMVVRALDAKPWGDLGPSVEEVIDELDTRHVMHAALTAALRKPGGSDNG